MSIARAEAQHPTIGSSRCNGPGLQPETTVTSVARPETRAWTLGSGKEQASSSFELLNIAGPSVWPDSDRGLAGHCDDKQAKRVTLTQRRTTSQDRVGEPKRMARQRQLTQIAIRALLIPPFLAKKSISEGRPTGLQGDS